MYHVQTDTMLVLLSCPDAPDQQCVSHFQQHYVDGQVVISHSEFGCTEA